MIIGVLTLSLYARGVHSLKEKRRIVLSIKEKLKNRFNISVIESDLQDVWQRIEISMAMISRERGHIEKVFNQSEEMVEKNYPVEVLGTETDYF